jgi:hypothetical protein
MRHLRWLALALLFAMPIGVSPTKAATPSVGLGMSGTSPEIVEVAVHCGPHARYIRGHRARTGHWIKGRCVRTRRR